MFNKFNYFNKLSAFHGKTKYAYKPYINYIWSTSLQDGVMVSPNIGTSKTPLLWKSGNPMDFQGSQYIIFDTFNLTNVFTICSRFSISTSSTSGNPIIGRDLDYRVIQIVNQNLIQITLSGEVINFNIPFTIELNKMYNLIVEVDNYNISLMIDDIFIETKVSSQLPSSYINVIGNTDSSYLDGQLDNLVIYNGILTQAQIQQSYTNPNQFYNAMVNDSNTLFCTDFGGNSSNIKDDKNGIEYPITNYSPTQRTNFKTESTGLQELLIERDSLGFFLGLRDYPKGNGVGYGDTRWVPQVGQTLEISLDADNRYYGYHGVGESNYRILIGYNSSLDVAVYSATLSKVLPGTTKLVTLTFDTSTIDIYADGVYHSSLEESINCRLPFHLFVPIDRPDLETTDNLSIFKVHNKILTQEEITRNYSKYQQQEDLV